MFEYRVQQRDGVGEGRRGWEGRREREEGRGERGDREVGIGERGVRREEREEGRRQEVGEG